MIDLDLVDKQLEKNVKCPRCQSKKIFFTGSGCWFTPNGIATRDLDCECSNCGYFFVKTAKISKPR